MVYLGRREALFSPVLAFVISRHPPSRVTERGILFALLWCIIRVAQCRVAETHELDPTLSTVTERGMLFVVLWSLISVAQCRVARDTRGAPQTTGAGFPKGAFF